MKKNITPEIAHERLVAYIGKEGTAFAMNDYYEMRGIVLFGTKSPGYVPNMDELLPGKVIDQAKKLMKDNVVVGAVRRGTGWQLTIYMLGDGYWRGDTFKWFCLHESMGEVVEVFDKFKDEIDDMVASSSALYITGDKDAVDEVAKLFDNPHLLLQLKQKYLEF